MCSFAINLQIHVTAIARQKQSFLLVRILTILSGVPNDGPDFEDGDTRLHNPKI